MDELPWVLLGLRTVPKDDLGASPAEMVYGAPRTIPRDFIAPPPEVDPAGHLRQLRNRVGALAPVPTAIDGQLHRQSSVPASLATTPFVLAAEMGRSSPYRRPTPVPTGFSHGGKTFTIDYSGREETVSINHLKPAHTDSEALSKWPSLHDGAAHLKYRRLHLQPAPSTNPQTRNGHAVRRP